MPRSDCQTRTHLLILDDSGAIEWGEIAMGLLYAAGWTVLGSFVLTLVACVFGL
jgi:hypothetical protein